MSLVSRIAPLLLASVLAGCVDPITPTSLNMEIRATYAPSGEGTCAARVSVTASGIGTATWLRVEILHDGVVETEYAGAAVADFWGATTVSAGQIVESAPFEVPAEGADVTLRLRYEITGSTRDATLRMECATPG